MYMIVEIPFASARICCVLVGAPGVSGALITSRSDVIFCKFLLVVDLSSQTSLLRGSKSLGISVESFVFDWYLSP